MINNPMNSKLQEALKKANAEVEKSGITDPELKKIAFSKAVDFYLGSETPQSTIAPRIPKGASDKSDDFWTSLHDSTGIEINKLKDVYSVKDKQILLVISSVPGDSKADKQRNLAALILLAYQEGLNYEWAPSSLLAEAANHSKLYDTSKFAKNIVQSDWFRTEGVRRGLKYKLSGPGVSEAKNTLSVVIS
ncbi:MAG: hypothetical protein A2Z11_04270 [Candidatus Woykebacteria bacterium RBG_16_43_9]|uniref:Uncharacterized protein n=1 Tax=Candidatus Woykebacteria bacterium RBG_16_43_9 TaxID=1802596 RepID=A0A1G1WGD0_9BACT|nr:MAG: hypothetical protein A2Z11_04270 [Candidatus Woykebacteria bacterium RBG_16_43_9]